MAWQSAGEANTSGQILGKVDAVADGHRKFLDIGHNVPQITKNSHLWKDLRPGWLIGMQMEPAKVNLET